MSAPRLEPASALLFVINAAAGAFDVAAKRAVIEVALAGGRPSWLVLYDAPGPDRKDGEHTVFADLLRRD